MRRCILWLLGMLTAAPVAFAQLPGDRQYYSGWTKHSTRSYYYRHFYYKKAAGDTTYTYHYGIYYPSRGKQVYMYNPHTRKFWGRWEGSKYSLLPKEKQKTLIDDIAAEDFPAAGAAPNIPGIDDSIVMIAPPDDFPKREPGPEPPLTSP